MLDASATKTSTDRLDARINLVSLHDSGMAAVLIIYGDLVPADGWNRKECPRAPGHGDVFVVTRPGSQSGGIIDTFLTSGYMAPPEQKPATGLERIVDARSRSRYFVHNMVSCDMLISRPSMCRKNHRVESMILGRLLIDDRLPILLRCVNRNCVPIGTVCICTSGACQPMSSFVNLLCVKRPIVQHEFTKLIGPDVSAR